MRSSTPSYRWPIVLTATVLALSVRLTWADCQGGPVFGQTVTAVDKNTLTWALPGPVDFVKGPLEAVSVHATTLRGQLPNATTMDISLDTPAPSTGVYYLFKSTGPPCSSWQTAPDAEPQRDLSILEPCSFVAPTEQDIADAVESAIGDFVDPWHDPTEAALLLDQTQKHLACAFDLGVDDQQAASSQEGSAIVCAIAAFVGQTQYCGVEDSTTSWKIWPAGSCLNDNCQQHDVCYGDTCVAESCAFSAQSVEAGCDYPLLDACTPCLVTDALGTCGQYYAIWDALICAIAYSMHDLPNQNGLCESYDACTGPFCDNSGEYDHPVCNCVESQCDLVAQITAEEPLNVNAGVDDDDDRLPAIATDGLGNWIAVWSSREDVNGQIGTDWDILYSVSTTDGATWSWPAPLSTDADDDGDFDNDSAPKVATDGSGTWIVVWQSDSPLGELVDTDYDILYSKSTDLGETWSPVAPLNHYAATDDFFYDDDRYPEISLDGSGNWFVVWQSKFDFGGEIGFDWDIHFATSSDGGEHWSSAAAVNSNAETDSSSDQDERPHMGLSANGDWIVVWQSDTEDPMIGNLGFDADILYARLVLGVGWTAPAVLNSFAATDENYEDDERPRIATDGNGTWIVVWQSTHALTLSIDTDWDILASKSTDDGATWGPVVAVNSNAATDGAFDDDEAPALGTESNGKWVAVWRSDDSLEGTIGGDDDILIATSLDQGSDWSEAKPLNSAAGFEGYADDEAVIVYPGSGSWMAVWASKYDFEGVVGTDWDILMAEFELP